MLDQSAKMLRGRQNVGSRTMRKRLSNILATIVAAIVASMSWVPRDLPRGTQVTIQRS